MDTIKLLVCLDEHYLPPLQVLLTSLYISHPGEKMELYLIHSRIPDQALEPVKKQCLIFGYLMHPIQIDSSFFREAVQILQPLLQKYQQRLEVTVQPALLLLEPSLLKTLVYNLIDNACKASPENGRILLTGRREEDVGYTLSVQDFGRGIPKEEIPHIIEPFYMVDKSRARSQNGAGIGLALCQEIAAIHGGSLHIESTLGEGTCVSLPLKEAEPDENHESSENPEN